jgi:UDP-MurNAc hydroxylase
MKVQMISHASVLIRCGDIAILSDPWFMGEAFNESWALVSEPFLKPTALKTVTHIWISHEHPDHLDFSTLKAIPADDKANITLLYQRHFSSRVLRALAKLGFRAVLELPLGRWVEISNGVSLMCWSVGTIDSLLAVRSGGAVILNVNDCIINNMAARAIAKRVGAVDVLLTQFSFANWAGNPEDADIIAPRQKLREMRTYIQHFKPRVTIPFASFVYFCHEENRFMNAWSNRPDFVCEQLRDTPTRVQFLYNGDSWSSQTGFQLNGDPIERYRADYNNIPRLLYRAHGACPLEQILDFGTSLVAKVRPRFKWFLLRKATPVYFYVYDIAQAICFDLRAGIVRANGRRQSECDIELGSQALWYAFKYPWGFGTLEVSGRYKLINRNVNKRALYLCHIYSSAFDSNGKWGSLLAPRSLSFWWSKRQEVFGRLLGISASRRSESVPSSSQHKRLGAAG